MVSVKHNGIEMSLNVNEAQALADVLQFVCGPTSGRRGFIKGIVEALKANSIIPDEDPKDIEDGEVRFL